MTLDEYKKKYDAIYDDYDNYSIANSLAEAKLLKTKMYRATCKTHGPIVFWTCDSSCPICCKIARMKRWRDNYKYNKNRHHYDSLLMRSKSQQLPFDLTREDLHEMLDSTNTCPVLGIKIKSSNKKHCDSSISVDKLIPSLGYTKTNVRIISNRANRIKSDATVEELMKVTSWLAYELQIPLDEAIQQTIIIFTKMYNNR